MKRQEQDQIASVFLKGDVSLNDMFTMLRIEVMQELLYYREGMKVIDVLRASSFNVLNREISMLTRIRRMPDAQVQELRRLLAYTKVDLKTKSTVELKLMLDLQMVQGRVWTPHLERRLKRLLGEREPQGGELEDDEKPMSEAAENYRFVRVDPVYGEIPPGYVVERVPEEGSLEQTMPPVVDHFGEGTTKVMVRESSRQLALASGIETETQPHLRLEMFISQVRTLPAKNQVWTLQQMSLASTRMLLDMDVSPVAPFSWKLLIELDRKGKIEKPAIDLHAEVMRLVGVTEHWSSVVVYGARRSSHGQVKAAIQEVNLVMGMQYKKCQSQLEQDYMRNGGSLHDRDVGLRQALDKIINYFKWQYALTQANPVVKSWLPRPPSLMLNRSSQYSDTNTDIYAITERARDFTWGECPIMVFKARNPCSPCDFEAVGEMLDLSVPFYIGLRYDAKVSAIRLCFSTPDIYGEQSESAMVPLVLVSGQEGVPLPIENFRMFDSTWVIYRVSPFKRVREGKGLWIMLISSSTSYSVRPFIVQKSNFSNVPGNVFGDPGWGSLVPLSQFQGKKCLTFYTKSLAQSPYKERRLIRDEDACDAYRIPISKLFLLGAIWKSRVPDTLSRDMESENPIGPSLRVFVRPVGGDTSRGFMPPIERVLPYWRIPEVSQALVQRGYKMGSPMVDSLGRLVYALSSDERE